jgi:hypothetical protein
LITPESTPLPAVYVMQFVPCPFVMIQPVPLTMLQL